MNYYLLDVLTNNKKGGTLKQLIYLAEQYRHPKYIYKHTNLHIQIIKNKSTKKIKYNLKIVNGKIVNYFIDYEK